MADAMTAIEPLMIAIINLIIARMVAPQIENMAARSFMLLVKNTGFFHGSRQVLFHSIKPSPTILLKLSILWRYRSRSAHA